MPYRFAPSAMSKDGAARPPEALVSDGAIPPGDVGCEGLDLDGHVRRDVVDIAGVRVWVNVGWRRRASMAGFGTRPYLARGTRYLGVDAFRSA